MITKREISYAGPGLEVADHADGGMKMCHWMNVFAYAQDGGLKSKWKNRV